MRFFDLHCDTLTRCFDSESSLLDGPQEVNLRKRRDIEEWCQCFAVFIGDNFDEAQGFAKYSAYVEYFRKEIELYRDSIALCRDSAEIGTALDAGCCAAFLTVENAAALGGDLKNIERFAADAVKIVSLTWNGENALGYGCGTGGRLKPFGKEAAAEFVRRGIVIDVSHLSDEGFYDIMELTGAPVIATHSNLRDPKLCTNIRNLSESQLRCIYERGGIIGLNLHKPFLSESEQDANDPATLLRHADRMLNITGESAVCIGSDFDGAQMPDYCRGIERIPALYKLFASAFGAKLADMIFFENARNFFSQHDAVPCQTRHGTQ